jgi:hypothetical protein
MRPMAFSMPPFPGRVRIAEEGLNREAMQMTGELGAIVECNGLAARGKS